MRWLATIVLAGCTTYAADPGPGPGPGPGSGSDGSSSTTPGSVDVVIDGLQPGWHVTVAHAIDHDAPVEATEVSDGSALTLHGSASDVFSAFVTDARGLVMASHVMGAPCTLAASHELRVPSDYATIQAAVDAARPGETVRVAAGTYSEAITLRPGVCLRGSGARHTILDAQGAAITLVDLSSAPGSAVMGFTFRGTTQPTGCADPSDPFGCSGDWYRAGVYIGGTSWSDPTHDAPPVIADNIFDGNDTGVMFYWRSAAVLRNNVFTSNRVAFVANHYQDRALVANNVFVNNTQLAIGNQAAYLDIIDNVIVGSQTAILFQYIQTGYIRCNIFYANGADQADIYAVPPRFTIGADGNVEAEPKFVGNGDFHLQPGSPGIDHGCHPDVIEPDGSAPDIGAFGGPLAAAVDF